MNIQEQISQWSSEGRFDLIIDAVGGIPESELDMFTLCQLALAYNNTDRLQESIDLLMGVWDIGEQDPVWNYYLGYALVFSGRKEEAREHLLRARELNPDIPAGALLHYCICYDGDGDRPVDDSALTQWVCEMLGGELDGNTVHLPESGTRIVPWFDDLRAEGTCSVSVYFRVELEGRASFFECCVGLGQTLRDAVTAALGSFYVGMYSALQKLCNKQAQMQIQGARGRIWSVYIGEVVGMGTHSMIPLECYWELLAQSVPDYLGGRSPVYIKIYGARNGDNITAECRVDDLVSQTLSGLLRNTVAQWDNQQFASHKQFFFLECEEGPEPYPYSQQQIDDWVRQTVELFCTDGMEYDSIPSILEQRSGDPHLAGELHAFIPELCADKAFENINAGDRLHISAGNQKIECTKWQMTSWRMIDTALTRGFQEHRYPEEAFRICVSASSTWSVICKAKEDGHDLLTSGGKVQRYYNFLDGYVLR